MNIISWLSMLTCIALSASYDYPNFSWSWNLLEISIKAMNILEHESKKAFQIGYDFLRRQNAKIYTLLSSSLSSFLILY